MRLSRPSAETLNPLFFLDLPLEVAWRFIARAFKKVNMACVRHKNGAYPKKALIMNARPKSMKIIPLPS